MRKAVVQDKTTPEPIGLSSRAAVSYFDRNADYYDQNQYRTTRRTFVNGRHDQLVGILEALELTTDLRVLDAGCGPGSLVPELARRGCGVCAMDASPNMLRLARSNAAGFPNVSYQAGNIEALPFGDASFDIVCSAGVIEYLEHCDRAIAEMYRVLRPGGLLILPTTNGRAPAHWLRPFLEPIARVPAVARTFGLKPGRYRLYYHRIPRFKQRLQHVGFVVERERHFYLTLPRPLDRLLPTVTRAVERFFDRFMHTRLRNLAEGYIAIARKPNEASLDLIGGTVRNC